MTIRNLGHGTNDFDPPDVKKKREATTMGNDYNYGFEKFMKAADILDNGTGGNKHRLTDACVYELMHITPANDLPPEMREEFESLQSFLTMGPTFDEGGAFASTIQQMGDEEVVQFIAKVKEMYLKLEQSREG